MENNKLKTIFINEARKMLDRMEAGECESISAEQTAQMLSFLTDEALSREQAANLTGDSLSTFADKVKRGILPQSNKRRGFKEKYWSKSELINAINIKRS